MQLDAITREPGDFQQPATAEHIQAMTARAFGPATEVLTAVELGGGMYNNTYRLQLADREQPVILRVAPDPGRQMLSERELMRTEYATWPYLAPISDLVPAILAADFTGQVIGRDYLFQELQPGVPAPDGLRAYERPAWRSLFHQLGEITARIHGVRGQRFGPITGPGHATWSEAVLQMLTLLAEDIDNQGLDVTDLRQVLETIDVRREVLDEITEPCLLHGDLWTVNLLIDTGAPTPTISGVLDCDRSLWGDPAADWTIRMAQARPGEREAFWDTYGPLDTSPFARWRATVYEARHLAALRLERHRRGAVDGVADSYDEMAAVLAKLRSGPAR